MKNEIENEILEELKGFSQKFGYKETLKAFDEKIISLNNPRLSVYFTSNANPNKDKHDEIILGSGDLEAIYECIRMHVSRYADDKTLETYSNYIYDSKDGKYNLKLAELFFNSCFSCYMNMGFSSENYYKDILIDYLNKHINGVINSENADVCVELRSFLEYAYSKKLYHYYPIDLGANILEKIDIFSLEGKIDEIIIKSGNSDYILNNISYHLDPYNVKISTKPSLSRYSEALISTGDAYNNYLFAKKYGHSKELAQKHGKVVIEDGDPRINYDFATKISGADIPSHSKAIIESKSPNFNYLFAKFVQNKKADIKKPVFRREVDMHLDEVIDVTSELEKMLDMVDIKQHEKAVLESKDANCNYQFALLDGADIEAHRKVVLESKDAMANYSFILLNDELSDDEKFDDYEHRLIVIESGNPEYNYKLASMYPNHELYDKHVSAVINSGNELYLKELNYLKTVMEDRINSKIKKLSL